MIHPSPPSPWDVAFVVALPHGVVVGVHLPGGSEPVEDEPMSRLLAPERALAAGLRGYRQVQFVGGRIAAAAAFAELGTRRAPVLSDDHGAPLLPEGWVGSISHKQDLAVVLVARGRTGVGVDLEDTDRPRPGVAARVLTAPELSAVLALPESRQWVDTVVRFSVKECVYKAVHPTLRRYVGFGEGLGDNREVRCEVEAHVDVLRALTGENKGQLPIARGVFDVHAALAEQVVALALLYGLDHPVELLDALLFIFSGCGDAQRRIRLVALRLTALERTATRDQLFGRVGGERPDPCGHGNPTVRRQRGEAQTGGDRDRDRRCGYD